MKSVLITGAGRRLGAHLAMGLAADGWHVAVHCNASIRPGEEVVAAIRSAGGSAALVVGDLGDPARCEDLVAEARSAHGRLDAIVHNASTFDFDTWETATEASLAHSLAVHAISPILTTQAFAKALPAKAEGVVVNILDNRIAAPNPDYFSYSIGKWALYGAMQTLACALAPRVRVCGIAPGVTIASATQTPENFRISQTLNPLGRGSSPEQVLAACRFLMSARSVNGEVIVLDGGESLAPHPRDVAFMAEEACG